MCLYGVDIVSVTNTLKLKTLNEFSKKCNCFCNLQYLKSGGRETKKKILGKRGGEEANNHWSSLSRTSKRTSFRKNVLNKISRKNKLNRSSAGGGDAGGSNAHPKVLIYKTLGNILTI